MSTADNDNNKDNDVCANCCKGEESTGCLKACTACKLVKYCNRECQIAHRPQHKKACRKRAKELHEEALFKQPPPEHGDCQICFLRLPSLMSGSMYMSCCGKIVCSGCVFAPVYDHEGNVIETSCPFCRSPAPKSGKEIINRYRKRIELNDLVAMCKLGCDYREGYGDLPQDYKKALELWHRAGKLGNAESYFNIGCFYYTGRGVEIDMKKATHYFELAAMGGDMMARHNLGCMEENRGNYNRAVKHSIIAGGSGCSDSLKYIQAWFKKGYATKEEYAKALQLYQEYLDEIKSDQRDEAAAHSDIYKYIGVDYA